MRSICRSVNSRVEDRRALDEVNDEDEVMQCVIAAGCIFSMQSTFLRSAATKAFIAIY